LLIKYKPKNKKNSTVPKPVAYIIHFCSNSPIKDDITTAVATYFHNSIKFRGCKIRKKSPKTNDKK